MIYNTVVLTEREGSTGKYLALGHGVWSECSDVNDLKLNSCMPDLLYSVNKLFILHVMSSSSLESCEHLLVKGLNCAC